MFAIHKTKIEELHLYMKFNEKDIPSNDTRLFFNLCNILSELRSDLVTVKTAAAREAINAKIREYEEQVDDMYVNNHAVQLYKQAIAEQSEANLDDIIEELRELRDQKRKVSLNETDPELKYLYAGISQGIEYALEYLDNLKG